MDHDIEMATRVWSLHGSADEAYRHARSMTPGATATDIANVRADLGYRWAWQWAEDGFWSLTCGHKYCAALACTKTDGLRDDLIVPAQAMRIAVPDGVLAGSTREVRFIYLLITAGGCNLEFSFRRRFDLSEESSDRERTCWAILGQCVEDVLFGDDDDAEETVGEERAKLSRLGRRVVAGLLFALQHTNNFRTKSYATSGPRRDGRGPPDHRVVVVGKPLSVDARAQVEAWLSNGKRRLPPSVQGIVRGHHKRQVIGVGGSGRKVIWVEPYWRGPEGAPILVHPRVIA